MERWQGKVAVVTGASAGIGAAIAKKLAEEGMIVVAVARRENKLQELAKTTVSKKGGKIVPFVADVTKEDQIVKFIAHAKSLGPINVLVNNAGIAYFTKVLDADIEKWRIMFELNVISLGTAIKETVNDMKAHKTAGHIINISSISAHGLPAGSGKHVYNGSKHAVRLITEGVRAELTEMKSNIKITMVSPGVVDTEIFGAGNWDEEMVRSTFPMLHADNIALGCIQVLSTPPNMLVADYIVRPLGEEVPA